MLFEAWAPHSCAIKKKSGGCNRTPPSRFVFSAVEENLSSLIEEVGAYQRDERDMGVVVAAKGNPNEPQRRYGKDGCDHQGEEETNMPSRCLFV